MWLVVKNQNTNLAWIQENNLLILVTLPQRSLSGEFDTDKAYNGESRLQHFSNFRKASCDTVHVNVLHLEIISQKGNKAVGHYYCNFVLKLSCSCSIIGFFFSKINKELYFSKKCFKETQNIVSKGEMQLWKSSHVRICTIWPRVCLNCIITIL